MKTLTIYFTDPKDSSKKPCLQVVRPSEAFGKDWNGLVQALTNGVYHSYNVS